MMYRQITSEERYSVGLLRQRGLRPAAIARWLDRHRSSLTRELRRNATHHDGSYRPQLAHWYATGRGGRFDIKRQGRAEVHIPLFYPQSEEEIRQMFVILAKKLGTTLKLEDVPRVPQKGQLSGADIEGIVGRAWRKSLLAGERTVTAAALADVVSQFMPSTQGMERELQEVAAMIECTDREFLPEAIMAKLEKLGGRDALQERLTALKQLVAAMWPNRPSVVPQCPQRIEPGRAARGEIARGQRHAHHQQRCRPEGDRVAAPHAIQQAPQ
jgi:hypothetical protein